MSSKIDNNQQNQIIYQNLKLKTLSAKDIKTFIDEDHSRYSLTLKLFPSPHNKVSIQGYQVFDFFHYLESIESNERLDLLFKLFYY